ncbi:unnamed protein product [Fusarium graminearum]|nr:unnamed protein product [Fusarium graminearum]VTO86190.1 unnamed protein product [Fusarium graminearum]
MIPELGNLSDLTYNETRQDKVACRRSENPAILAVVRNGMGKCLEDNNATKPSVEEVVCVKGDVQQRDQRIVSSSQ